MARTRTRIERSEETPSRKTALASDGQRNDVELEEAGELTVRKDRPTPSSRQLKPRGIGSGGFVNRIPVLRSVVAYFRGVVSEMQKVTWPTREEATRLTSVVLGVTAAFAVGLGILDTFLGWWFRQAFHVDSEWIFLAVAAVAAAAISGGYVALRHRL